MFKLKPSILIVGILIISLLLRVSLFVGILFKNPNGFFEIDSFGYWKLADNIIRNGIFSQSEFPPLLPDHTRTPVYPLFISLFRYIGLDVHTIIFFQILISSFTCLFTILIAYKLVNNWNIAFIAGAILSLDIPSISSANSLLTETLFTFLFVISILYLVFYFKGSHRKNRLLFASGIYMGFSILCHPVATFFPIFVIIILLLNKAKYNNLFVEVAIYLISCFIVLSPWLIRNKIVFDSVFLSTIGFNNLLDYRAAGVYSVKEGISIDNAREILRKKTLSEFKGDVTKEPVKYREFEAKIAFSIIFAHPFIYIRNHIWSVINMLFKPIRSTIDLQLGLSKNGTTLTKWGEKTESSLLSKFFQNTSKFTVILVIFQFIMLFVLWITCIYSIVLSIKRREYIFFSILFSILLYFCIVGGGPEVYARFRVPLVPFIAIFSAVGLENLKSVLIREMKK